MMTMIRRTSVGITIAMEAKEKNVSATPMLGWTECIELYKDAETEKRRSQIWVRFMQILL